MRPARWRPADEADPDDLEMRVGRAPLRSMRQLALQPQRMLRDIEPQIRALLAPLGRTGLLGDYKSRPGHPTINKTAVT